MMIFYDIFLLFYKWAMSLASLWSIKAKKWVIGRQNWYSNLQYLNLKQAGKIIWFHAASLGEFEQGRPLMEMIKRKNPEYKILLSFFSPSGYEVRKNTPCADWVVYLPLDNKLHSKKWVENIQPKMVFFIKYESWYYYLRFLKDKSIPAYLISANFREEQNFFGPLGGFLRKMLDLYSHIFVQNTTSFHVLEKYNIKTKFSISGDTRFDRVWEISRLEFQNQGIASFCRGRSILVAGSTWTSDVKIIAEALEKTSGIGLIIAPHEIHESHLEKIEREFKSCIRLSKILGNTVISTKKVLIVDGFGMLSSIYRFGKFAYVGGGFNKAGIHNVLEAAVYGIPVAWGPNHERAFEAQELIDAGGGSSIQDEKSLQEWLIKLNSNNELYTHMCSASEQYVTNKKGATEKIYSQTVDTSID